MQNDYDSLYEKFEKDFKENALSLISNDKINATLKTEKCIFNNAKKNNIPAKLFTGNNPARYTKDAIRRNQSLFSIYYLLSMFTEFFYCLLIWSVLKCIFLYFTGSPEAFTQIVPLSLSPVFFAAVILCNNIKQLNTRRLLSKYKVNVKSKITVSNIIFYFISAFIIIIPAFLIYKNIGTSSLLHLTLFEIFIITAGLLFISGIHNVIFSSHAASFIAIGQAVILNRSSDIKSCVAHYRELSLTDFLSSHNLTMSEYTKNDILKTEFNMSLRSKIITFRMYGALAFIIMAALTLLCLWRILTYGFSLGFIIFTIISVLINTGLILEILSCNFVLKTTKKV